MIIIKISGGIGNQLFQYAFAKALEQKNKITVKIDISSFQIKTKTITPRHFFLEKFNISLNVARRDDFHSIGVPFPLDRGLKENLYRVIFKVKEYFRNNNSKKITIDHRLNYNESTFKARDNRYLAGSWTSPQYFNGIKELIIKEITPRFSLNIQTQELLLKIKNHNSISIHIRRGDYLKYAHKFAILDENYYQKAIEIIKNKVEKPVFFIFSDDIEYVKKTYDIIFGGNAFYVSGQEIPDYEEFWLMSQCKHNIIANSTFSWWGAWLNQNPEKIIIAPKQYRNDNKDISGFFPEDWIIT